MIYLMFYTINMKYKFDRIIYSPPAHLQFLYIVHITYSVTLQIVIILYHSKLSRDIGEKSDYIIYVYYFPKSKKFYETEYLITNKSYFSWTL